MSCTVTLLQVTAKPDAEESWVVLQDGSGERCRGSGIDFDDSFIKERSEK